MLIGTRAGPVWLTLLAAFGATAAADTAYLTYALGGSPTVPAWVDLLWLASCAAAPVGAWLRPVAPKPRPATGGRTVLFVPVTAAVTAVIVLVLGNTRQLPEMATALATLTVLASVAAPR